MISCGKQQIIIYNQELAFGSSGDGKKLSNDYKVNNFLSWWYGKVYLKIAVSCYKYFYK